jgi:cysteine desulfurase/selenocysteine lyase
MDNIYRKDFPIFNDSPVVYLDTAATAQRPKQVMDAVVGFYEKANANPLRGLYEWSVAATDMYEKARQTVAEFINADDASEIIFTRNTTESLNLVAYSYALNNLEPGDEIAVTIMEHHSNFLVWQMAAEKTGAKLVFLEPLPDGTLTDEEINRKLSGKTRIVAAGHVSNVLGCTNPIKKLSEAAHRLGAVMVVDGAQSTPHTRVDVKELGADFFAFSGHKLMGPMGIGVLYGKKAILENMPPFLRGGEMIEKVTRDGATYAELPHKFEAGTVNAAGAVGLEAAIKYLKNVGFDYIKDTENALTEMIIEGMSVMPHVSYYGSKDYTKHEGIVTFNIEGCHPHDVASVLDSEHIAIRAGHHCAQPLMQYLGVQATARASIYFYNTKEDVEKFLKALGQVRGWLGYRE